MFINRGLLPSNQPATSLKPRLEAPRPAAPPTGTRGGKKRAGNAPDIEPKELDPSWVTIGFTTFVHPCPIFGSAEPGEPGICRPFRALALSDLPLQPGSLFGDRNPRAAQNTFNPEWARSERHKDLTGDRGWIGDALFQAFKQTNTSARDAVPSRMWTHPLWATSESIYVQFTDWKSGIPKRVPLDDPSKVAFYRWLKRSPLKRRFQKGNRSEALKLLRFSETNKCPRPDSFPVN